MLSSKINKNFSDISNDRGNILVFIALALSSLLVIGGFAIESTLYLLKRQKLQILAEGVAVSSALNFPLRSETAEFAASWYNKLVIQTGDRLGPDWAVDTVEYSFMDNINLVSNAAPYLLSGFNFTINQEYSPSVLPVGGLGALTINIKGEAQAQLVPTDVILIVENTASFYEANSIATNAALIAAYDSAIPGFGYTPAAVYTNQCFGDNWATFKKGVVTLYDILSQIGTFRVGVILTTSRSGEPYILSELDVITQIQVSSGVFEYDDDAPHNHSTRCIAMTDADGGYPVPPNVNSHSSTWEPRIDLSILAESTSSGPYGISAAENVLVREALWILPAGYSSFSGSMNPRSYYHNPRLSLDIALRSLRGSRRSDGQPVRQRVVIVLTDDAGIMPAAIFTEEGVDPDTQSYVSDKNWCDHWGDLTTEIGDVDAKLIVVYYGHNQDLIGHSYDDTNGDVAFVDSLRADCMLAGNSNSGRLFIEDSPAISSTAGGFSNTLMPLLAHSLKQAELRK